MRVVNKKGKGFNIQYAGRNSWNPISGCDDVSEGCRNCYARSIAVANKRYGHYTQDGICGKFTDTPGAPAPGFGVELKWNTLRDGKLPTGGKERRVFVCDMSDPFHKDVPVDFIQELYQRLQDPLRIKTGTQWLLLTKRAPKMKKVVKQVVRNDPPPENIWLGTTIELNSNVNRADYLRDTPAAIRWLCLEPLLGPLPDLDLTGIDWVVAGGESGPRGKKMRPIQADWVREIRDKCVPLGIPFMFKHWGHKDYNPDPTDPSLAGDPKGGCRLDRVFWEQVPE